MAKCEGYCPKSTAPGIWNVYKEGGALVTQIGVGFDRAKARRFVFLLNTGKIHLTRFEYTRGLPTLTPPRTATAAKERRGPGGKRAVAHYAARPMEGHGIGEALLNGDIHLV